MEVLEPAQQPWIAEGESTRCTVHDQLFGADDVCPVGGCFGAPAKVTDDDSAVAALLADESLCRAQADLWRGVSHELIARAALPSNRKRERVLRELAADASKESRAWLRQATPMTVVRARRQHVKTLRSERAKTRRRRAN